MSDKLLLTRGCLCTLCLVFWVGGASRAEDFIRGDANTDGVVSISDAHVILSYLFDPASGVFKGCLDACDANDDGDVSIVDIAAVNVFLFLGWELPAPSPSAGPDPTEDDLTCSANENGFPLEDPNARMEILDVFADGGEDGTATIVVAVSNSETTSACYGSVHLDPGLATGVRDDFIVLTESVAYGFTGYDDDRVDFSLLRVAHEPAWLPPGQSVPVLEIPICLAEGTPAGEYSLSLVAAEITDMKTGRAIYPEMVGGKLTVLGDVTVSEDCYEEEPPPPPLNAEYGLSDGSGSPGGSVDVTFAIKADAGVQGYSASIDFDEEVLDAQAIREIWKQPDGKPFGFSSYEINNDNNTPGNDGVDEGFLIGVAVFSFVDDVTLPAGVASEVLQLQFDVRPDAEAQATELRFLEGAQGLGEPVLNAITANGRLEYTQHSASSFIFINGRINIVPDILTFVRGDSNGDGAVDLSDAQTTLSFLFLGSESVSCFDAADANDDGGLNISDPVATLQYLFLGGPELPPPFPEIGTDPTDDAMGCSTIISS